MTQDYIPKVLMNIFMSINSCCILVENFCKGVHIPSFNQFSFLLKNIIIEFWIRWYHNWPSCQACSKYWTISKMTRPKKKRKISWLHKDAYLYRWSKYNQKANQEKCMWLCNIMAHIKNRKFATEMWKTN